MTWDRDAMTSGPDSEDFAVADRAASQLRAVLAEVADGHVEADDFEK